jgi:hypothetical protein
MIDLSWAVQDVIVTALAMAAFGILVYRTVGVIRPAAGEPPCTACGACPRPPTETADPTTVVPLNDLRRRHRSSERSSPGIRLIG